MLDTFVNKLNGRRNNRLPFWNASDDDPKLTHTSYSLFVNNGEVRINAYEIKNGVEWVTYPCSGDSFKNKFAVTLFTKNGIVPITDFINITQDNLEKYLGQFGDCHEMHTAE